MFARSCLAASICGLLASPAWSHPHIFVDAQAGFRFDDQGRLTALRITWTYDAFTSLTMFDILDLDKDNDGALDDADRAAIVKGETEWQEGYKGDTYLELAGADVPLARPLNGSAKLEGDRITVAFDLPLQAPLKVTDAVILKLYDPVYYYAYSIVGVELPEAEGCRVDLAAFVADDAAAELQSKLALLSREETPDQDNVGRLFADHIRLTCG